MNEARNRYPFTPSQWQELEHQALIFKYMASGVSIPPDLLFSLRTTTSSFPHPQAVGWNYLQMGLGSRKIDAEPGRCRRTDGKKWRCSKEAFPNSKYCERHMHRGNHRFRKQPPLKTTPSPTTTTCSKNNNTPYSFLYPHHHHPQFSRVNHRYVYDGVLKEEVDEHAFFTEPSGAIRTFSASSMDIDSSNWHLTPLTISSSSSSSSSNSKSNHFSNYLQLQNDHHNKAEHEEEPQEGNCYNMLALGKLKESHHNQKTIHRFFDDNSWLDLEQDKSSTTQLSISIPTTSDPPPHHFPTLRDA